VIYLDTHVVAWLHAGLVDRFDHRLRNLMNREDLYVSPMAILELQYLYETGRVATPTEDVMSDLAERIGLQVCDAPFGEVVAQAVSETWTRDPFDRIIVAQAALRRQPLVSKDQTIRQHYPHAVWF